MYRVLIVDDEPFVIEGMKTAIDWTGFNFEICCSTTNPLHALEYLENNPVDLLITDISMPQMDGLELIQRVRKINSLISILVLSAYDNFEYVRTAMRHGAENYLLKPLNPDELGESISRIVSHLKERSTLSNTYGSMMLTFRSIFTESWVKGSLSEDEFITRAQMLGVNLYLNNYTVLIFTADEGISQTTEKMSHLFDYLLSLFVGTYISHFYFETPSRLVCIISNPTTELPLASLLSDLENARVILNFPFFVSAGNTVNNYEDVSVSYRNAKKYLFLQYTKMSSFIYQDMDLPIPSLNVIEQDYTDIAEQDYLTQVTAQLDKALPPSKHIPCILSVLSWCTSQTSTDLHPHTSVIELLKCLKPEIENNADMIAYLHTFIHTGYEVLSQKQQLQTATYPCVDAVINAVHEFSDKDISLKTLAAKLNMHPSYLGNIFHQQTGFYFNDYLNDERLKYAAGLMENTDMKLKDIVDQAGFSSQTYFNRLFKRRYGAPPNAYRRELRARACFKTDF